MSARTFADLQVGESFDVAGRDLHEDLAGLVCVITAAEIERTAEDTVVTDRHTDSKVWFKTADPIDMHRRHEAEMVKRWKEGDRCRVKP